MSSKRLTGHRLNVELQYPPHEQPLPVGQIVGDFPPAEARTIIALGWIEPIAPTVTLVDVTAFGEPPLSRLMIKEERPK